MQTPRSTEVIDFSSMADLADIEGKNIEGKKRQTS